MNNFGERDEEEDIIESEDKNEARNSCLQLVIALVILLFVGYCLVSYFLN